MRIQDTDAWNAVEWRYTSIQTALMMPFPGLAKSPGEIIEELDEIVHECPESGIIKRPASVSARHSVSTDWWMICVLLTLSNCGRIRSRVSSQEPVTNAS